MRVISFAATIALALIFGYVLVTGRALLVPFAIAVLIWYLINATADGYGRIPLGPVVLPRWLCLGLAICTMFFGLYLVAELIGNNISGVADAAPRYQENLEDMLRQITASVGLPELPNLIESAEYLDLRQIVLVLSGVVADMAGDAGLILIYVAFLLAEQSGFDKKLRAMVPDPARATRIRAVLDQMQKDIRTYISLKTMLAILTGGVTYVVLVVIGVDFAGFWAFFAFLLNYIPTIGALIAVIFPAVLALVQFGQFTEALVVAGSLAFANFLISNVIEPRLMGKTLNISPLVVILSLSLWGALWGVAGMFLCVPLTAIVMIILAQIPQTRPVALALSADGDLK